MKCLNLSDLNIKKIVNDFGEQKTSELLDKYFLDKKIPTIDEFVNHLKVAKELNIIPISKVKDEIGKSYPKQISNSQLIDLKKQVSNINNKLKGVVYKLLNIQQVGQADLFTWKLRKLNGNLDLEAKLERAKEQSKNTIESFNRIKKLEDKLKEEKETKEIKKLIEQKEVTNSRNLEYFNGNEILLEQEQNEDNLIQKELDKIVTKINNESRQLDLFESFQNIITNENKPTPIDTTKSAGLLWGKMSSYESETNFQPTESKSQYRSDNSLQEKINGRDFKEIWNSNEFTQLERENILLHSIQERMLDKNTFNGELFAGINSKLGKLELRVVDNEKYPFLAFQKQIYINPKTFLKYLQNANIEDVDKYLDLTVSEELIHVLTNYFTSLEDIKKIATEINPNNFKYIQSIYKSLPSGDFELGTREYLRMIVQQEILGTTTEKIKYTKNGVIDSIIDKIWNFLYQIFKDNKGTLAEKVKKHIDFIKSNNVDSTNNYKPDIFQVESILGNNRSKFNTIDEDLRSKYFSESNTTDSLTILEKISNSNHPLSLLANKLIPFVKNSNSKITLVKKIKTLDNRSISAGVYLPKSNSIEILENASFRGLGSEVTILHEILHSLTFFELRYNSKLTEDFKILYDNAKQYFKKYDTSTQEGTYALLDIDEFIVALFTDSKFINELKNIKAVDSISYKNMLEEILDLFFKLFKIDKKSDISLFEQSFNVATNIILNGVENRNLQKEMNDNINDYYNSIDNVSLQNLQVETSLNQDIKYQLSKEQLDAIDNVFDENPELANAVYSVLGFKVIKESDITYTDEEGKTCAEMGLTTNQNPKFGDWEIIKDLKGSPTHKQGGIDLSIKGNTIEAEGNELVLKNSVGDLAIIPKKDRLKIKDLIADNNEKALNNYISALPKNPNKAGDGGIYSDKYVKNNFFNRIFRRNNILEKQIMDENRSLYNVGKLKDFKILEATGKSKQHLEKTNRNPEYFPKGDTWFPYLDDVSQPIKLPNKNKYRTLVNDDNLSDDQLKNAVKFDFISHSLHNDKRYNDLSTQLSQKLLTKYDQKFIDNNGGVDAYVRGILSDSEDYKPYKDETSFIEPEFINEFKNYIKTGK